MKITAIKVYQVDLPLVEGRYSWSEGKFVEVFDSTVVEIFTDDGHVGYGEVCPLGPFYLPAFGDGARAGIGELAPTLLGQNPTAIGPMNQLMDRALLGHPYVKSAIDMACWDLLGKVTGKSVCDLMGGKFGDAVALYRAISQRPADEMAQNVAEHRADGYTKFQLKVGGRPGEDIDRIHAAANVLTDGEVLVADANTGWRVDDAVRVVNAVRDVDVYIEQPCRSYEHCLTIRRRTSLPFILDENIDGIDALLRGHHDGAMDAINLKISKVGGLTKARQIRDLCVTLNIPMTIEDSWGGDIITAAIAHLAHSTPESLRFSATDFNSYVSVKNATGAPQRKDGHMVASDSPGLGIAPNMHALGKPVAEYTG
ncbi:MAG: mandelate racemase/muconate lactonizing enzyme family protein [Proteobacteria bacterium]|nr:mandelate racemase/muconate lactonizing enzyme family protein [Pseudomonadota bacterium]MDA0992352.1 mandelate racemase/muconate lactonizing enzyme family protein [Pseudomonadota bacterium]